MSLYIPHCFKNITEERIKNIFFKLEIGKIGRIDFVEKIDKNGVTYNSLYVHFEYWFDSNYTRSLREKAKNGDAKVVYDDPWYWVVLENRSKPKVPGQRKQRIDLSGLYSLSDIDSCECKSIGTIDTSFGDVDESYDLVDSEYPKKLEEELNKVREAYYEQYGLAKEYEHKNNLLMDEVQCLKNHLSSFYAWEGREDEYERLYGGGRERDIEANDFGYDSF